MIEITLAGAPMGKQRVRVVKSTGRVYTPERTVSYEASLAYAGQCAMVGRPLFDQALSVTVLAYIAIPESKPKKWKADALAGLIRPTKKPDADNIAKMIDALNLIVWIDDAQIVDLRSRKFYSDKPRLVVQVEAAQNEGIFA